MSFAKRLIGLCATLCYTITKTNVDQKKRAKFRKERKDKRRAKMLIYNKMMCSKLPVPIFRVKPGNIKAIIKYLECIKNKLHHACFKMILTQFQLFCNHKICN